MPTNNNEASEAKLGKKEYYERSDVVSKYDRFRFGGRSGPWIKQSEESTVRDLLALAELPAQPHGIDLPTGTGRMIPVLRARLTTITAIDISAPMLEAARGHQADAYLLGDASAIAVGPGEIDFILSSRFYFHFSDLTGFFAEAARVLKSGGYLLFDAYNWTPRSLIPGKQAWLSGRVYVHSRRELENYARRHGFNLVADRGVFVITPYIYQFLPLFVTRTVERIGGILLGGRKTKSYYLLRKI